MSGVGGYEYNFLSSDWVVGKVQLSEALSYKITIVDKKNSVQLFKYIRNESENTIKITLKVTGIEINGCTFRVYDNASMSHTQDYKKDGIYQINYTATEGSDRIYFYVFGGNMGQLDNPITIEQLPLYPGALVFDGVDDYGVCDNFPILTKEKGYTVVALRQWITRGEIAQGLVSNVKNWLKDGAFLLEYRNIQADHLNKPISFGAIGSEMDLPHILTYQTSKSYNGVSITTGNFEGTDVLHVGKLSPTNVGTCINAAIWELVFLDHDATEEELTKIKDYFVKTYPWLFPDQAWTVTGKTNEDKDRATIANITGNGNDLRLSNFGFAEGSGYNEEGEYAGYLVTDGVDDVIQSKRFLLHRNWTMVGDWRFMPPEKNTNSGIVKSPAIKLYNQLNNIAIYINRTTNPKSISGRSIKTVCSDGRIYLDDWSEFLDTKLQTDFDNNAVISIANYGVNFTKMIFKNLSFYDNQLLSKDDCIKAYNYLQTLKAK